MKLVYAVTLTAMVGTLAGCKSTPKNSILSLSSTTPERTFTFKKLQSDAKNVVTQSSIKQALQRFAKEKAGYNHCEPMCYKQSTADIRKTWGRDVTVGDSFITVSYINGEIISGGGSYLTKTKFELPYSIIDTADSYKVTIKAANSAVENQVTDALFFPISPLVDGAKINELHNNIFSQGVPNIKASVYKSGEFDVEYDPASVTTNFERKFKRLSSDISSDKRVYEGNYEVFSDGVNARVNLKVYLYRGKSKVEYRVSHPVTVYGDGKSDWSNQMDTIVAMIERVASS